jgi:hypothetical protein
MRATKVTSRTLMLVELLAGMAGVVAELVGAADDAAADAADEDAAVVDPAGG